MPIIYIATPTNLGSGNTSVYTGTTWPPTSFQTYNVVNDPLTCTLQYYGGSYVRYVSRCYFSTSVVPSDATVSSAKLYAYVSYANLGDSPIYLFALSYYNNNWYTSISDQVFAAGQIVSASISPTAIYRGVDTWFELYAAYTTLNIAPTTINQFNLPISQIRLEITVDAGIQMIV